MLAYFLAFLAALSVANGAQFLNCNWVSSLDCATYKPGVVCASTGQDYPNSCYLARDQCKDQTLHLQYIGSCASHGYTVAGTTMAPVVTTMSPIVGGSTMSPTTREPIFTNHNQLLDFFCLELMHQACPTNTEKVCGTDNVTYDNVCEYEKARCAHRSLDVKSFGMC
ncbi:hypothetical protein ACF0H5_001089 [Mactra antiquata]